MKLLHLVTVLAFAWMAPYTWGQVPAPDQVPKFISYQGFLTDSEGNKMTGPHNLTFSLYRCLRSDCLRFETGATPSRPMSNFVLTSR